MHNFSFPSWTYFAHCLLICQPFRGCCTPSLLVLKIVIYTLWWIWFSTGTSCYQIFARSNTTETSEAPLWATENTRYRVSLEEYFVSRSGKHTFLDGIISDYCKCETQVKYNEHLMTSMTTVHMNILGIRRNLLCVDTLTSLLRYIDASYKRRTSWYIP